MSYRQKIKEYIDLNREDLSIYKVYNLIDLEEEDLLKLKKVLWEELGTYEEFVEEFKTESVSRAIRELIGVNRDAVIVKFTDFLRDNSLSLSQARLIDSIVDRYAEVGYMEREELEEGINLPRKLREIYTQKPLIDEILSIVDSLNSLTFTA